MSSSTAIRQVSRRKKSAVSALAFGRSIPVNNAAAHQELPRVKKSRKKAMRVLLQTQKSFFPRSLQKRFGGATGSVLPFQRTLGRSKSLFVGRAPAQARRVVLPPSGTRKH